VDGISGLGSIIGREGGRTRSVWRKGGGGRRARAESERRRDLERRMKDEGGRRRRRHSKEEKGCRARSPSIEIPKMQFFPFFP
jgi:hypothetical protein